MKKQILAILLAGALTVPSVPMTGASAESSETVFRPSQSDASLSDLLAREKQEAAPGYRADDIVSAMVELKETPDADRDAVLELQEETLSEIAVIAGVDDLAADFHYTETINGFSVKIPYGVLAEVAALESVEEVHVAVRYKSPEAATVPASSEEDIPTANEMVGGTTALNHGYDGSGMLVAVIDTGIDADHPAFAGDLDKSELALTFAELSKMLDKLNASAQYEELTAEDVYYSDKIPFGFNYIDNSTDISHDNDDAGDHGTHVAGILAADGEDSEITGIAPGAQLLVMKVFGQSEEDASEAALVAAIEDAVTLGADVINMSLGGTVGFSQEGTTLAKVIQSAMDRGVVVCAAAGNEVSSAYGNLTGTNLSKSENVDIGAICAPGAQSGVLAVASVEYGVSYTEGFLVTDATGEEKFISISDNGPLYGAEPFSGLINHSGHEVGVFEYVCVPGLGAEEDYGEIDVEGRIALVSRGELTFTEKSENAFLAGAVAMVVYNNTDETVNMDLTGLSRENTIPCVFVNMEAGELLVKLAGEDGVGRLTVSDEIRRVQTGNSGQPSDFSSWGGGSDLTLKPEFSGVGGNVYSTVNGGTYGIMSGTSMATPQVSGGMAVLLQYLEEERGITGTRAAQLAKTLLMNTADPALQSDGVEYSPRKQGAGLIDLEGALETDVYLTVDGSALPKAELKDSMSGQYAFSMTVHNMSDEDRCFVTSTSILTECAQDGYMLQWARRADADVTVTSAYTSTRYLYDLNRNNILDEGDVQELRELIADGGADVPLEHYDLNGDGVTGEDDTALFEQALDGVCDAPDGLSRVVVTVPARGTSGLYVRVRLSDEEKKNLQEIFESGIYIEGYVTLNGYSEAVETLSVPVLAFYGDWSEGALFETTDRAEQEVLNWDGSSGNCPIPFAVYTGGESYLGMNPVNSEAEYLPERSNALNLTGDEGGIITEIYLDLLRSARRVTVEVVSQSGLTLYRSVGEEVPKSCYSDQHGEMVPVVWTMMDESFSFDPADYGLKAGERFLIRITGWKDCVGVYQTETIEIPVYLDGTDPKLLDVQVERGDKPSDSCEVTLTMEDDFYVAGVMLLTADGETVVDSWAVDQQARGEETDLTLDVTEYISDIGGQFVVAVVDYAQNTSLYDVSVLEEGETSLLPEGTMLAYNGDVYEGGWSAFGLMGKGVVTDGFRNYLGTICAAEAVGDTIFAVLDDAVDTLYAIDCATFLPEATFDLGLEAYMDEVLDLAWCEQDGMMYVLVRGTDGCRILRVDLREETVEPLCSIGGSHSAHAGAYALACDGGGTVYLIAGEHDAKGKYEKGYLYTVDRVSGEVEKRCSLGIELENSVISAVMDQSSGVLYFTHYYCSYDLDAGMIDEESSTLYSCVPSPSRIKVEKVRDLGDICYDALVLTDEPKNCFSAGDGASELHLSHGEEYLLVGRSFRLEAVEYRPWYVNAAGYVLDFDSSDPGVARVDAEGVVTAAGPGEAEITVTASREGEEPLTARCHVVVETDTFFTALRGSQWIRVSLNTFRETEVQEQMMADASAAAFGAAAGPDGQDVVYVVDKGQLPEDGTVPFYTLYTHDAESGALLESAALSNRWALLGEDVPETGFSDMAFDSVQCLLLAVSGRNCYSIDPVSGEIRRVYSMDECPEDRELVGVAFDDDGTGWFVDSKASLYRLEGYYVSSVVSTMVAEFHLASVPGTTSLEYDQPRGVLWLRWGWSMYAVDLEAENLRAIRKGRVSGDVSCLFMPRY